ncbi:MAG TPA: hypothetical protein VFS21_16535 [Roseiflexaceae bacterium]|nr:hypothetical protein [Roseiflexaceae bacterium]
MPGPPAVFARHARLALVLAALLVMLPPGRAASQDAPITVQVRAAYDGAYRPYTWFPVDVTLANDGPDVSGVLEWRFPGLPGESAVQYALDLPSGTRKRVVMYAMARNFARNGELRLISGTDVLAQRDVQIRPIDTGTFLIGVISSDRALLNSLAALDFTGLGGTEVHHFDAASLPEQGVALNNLNALFLHDLDSAALTRAQREALALWVQQGGQLVVGGGLNAERSAGGLADLLPAELAGGIRQADLAPLASLAGADAPAPPENATVAQATARPGAQTLSGEAPLLFARALGGGRVVFAAFDLAELRGWEGEVALWQQALQQRALISPATSARQERNTPFQDVLRRSAPSLPAVHWMLLALILYVTAVGPLNYVLLQRTRRLEWAWVTLPLTMLLFTVVFYVIGFGLRDRSTPINQIALVQGVAGQPRSAASAFINIFSTDRGRYTIDFPGSPLVSELQSRLASTGAVAPTVLDEQVQVRDLVVDVGGQRVFTAETMLPSGLPVESSLSADSQRVSGTLRYSGDAALDDVLLVRGGQYQVLGRVAPGEQREVLVEDRQGTFLSGYMLGQTGAFNRQKLIEALFSGVYGRQWRDQQAVYLLAWRAEPAFAIRLNDQPALQDALTLYIVQLSS